MKEFTLKNKTYLLVEVPKDSEYKLIKQDLDNFNTIYLVWTTKEMNDWHWEDPIKNDCSIIGKLSDILKDEKICSELVEYEIAEEELKQIFKDYKIESLCDELLFDYLFATDSFNSFLQSQQIDLTKNYLLIEKL